MELKAQEILSRFDLTGGALLPFIAPQKYNERLKELFHYCRITRTVIQPNKNTRGPELVCISDIASSHMARRAFCGNLYNQGAELSATVAMSGHVEGSRSFAPCRKIEKADLQKAIKLIE